MILVLLAVPGPSSSKATEQNFVIKMGYLPDQESLLLQNRYNLLAKYLAAKTGFEFQLVHASTYLQLVKLVDEGKIDLANFGGLTFLRSFTRGSAKPLVMRNSDLQFTSSFIIGSSVEISAIEQSQKRSFTFANRLSTSGHLMPRHFLHEKGINPESFFSEVHYTETHDQVIKNVISGRASVGVLNSLVLENFFEKNPSEKDKIKILWKSPPYVDYVWVVHKYIDAKVADMIRSAFLNLSNDNLEESEILRLMQADYFLPAQEEDFTLLQKTADSLGLLEPE